MTGEDSAAREYARIIAEIRGQLTGDPEHDGPLLIECADRYRQHPLAQEVLREIARMHFEGLPHDARAQLQEDISGVYEPFQTGLAESERQWRSGDADGARRTLERIIEHFDPAGDSFGDDAVSEYRMFPNAYEAALYQKLFAPTRQVRGLPYDLAQLYLGYGTTLFELRDLDAAEPALRRALWFNPVNPIILFELGEVLKMQQRWAEFHQLSTFALSVCFGAEQAARAYRNLGFYYTEQGNYDVAAACYLKSGSIDKQSMTRCAHELTYIEQQTGKPVPASDAEAVDETLRANGIQVGVSEAVRDVMAELDGQDNVERDIFETLRTNVMARNVSTDDPEQLAALLLACSGQYRNHPKTPEIVRRSSWMACDGATPDFRAKLALAITRLAERGTAGPKAPADESRAGLAFIDELELRATHPGPEGTVGVLDRNTGVVVAQYDFSERSVTVNQEVASGGSNFPPGTAPDAVALLLTYVGELTFPESA